MIGCVPFLWQINAINAATEAACLILSVDETVKNPKVYSYFLFFFLFMFENNVLIIV